LFGGGAQPAAKHSDEAEQCTRMVVEERHNVTPLKHRQTASRYCLGVGRSGFAVKQGKLTEEISRLHDCEHDFFPFR
jgi:hypothetical protein